jgi:Cu2+-containing amine oxidase
MKACCTSVATTVLLWPVVLIAQNDIETRGEEISQSLVKRHVAWQTKLSSTGASIEAKQVARRGSWVQYHLYVTGLPSDQLYAVVTWPVTQREP